MPRGSLTQWNQDLDRATLQNYTGEQIQQKDPKRYQAIIQAAKEGATRRMLQNVFGINHRTAKAIVEREAPASLSNQQLSSRWRYLTGITTEQLIEKVEEGKMSGKDLSVVGGIATEKMVLTEKDGGQEDRHKFIIITSDHLNHLVKTAKPDVIDAEVVETKVLDTPPTNTLPLNGIEKTGGGGQQELDNGKSSRGTPGQPN